jgi:hypothetical protein
MNKAFVRESDFDPSLTCPRCGTQGVTVWSGPLDAHIREEFRKQMGESALFCESPRCEVVYFNRGGDVVTAEQLNSPAYPHDLDAPICACFGLRYDDVAADVREGQPKRIRELLAKSKSPEARCQSLALDGRCCMPAVQELYLKLRSAE